MGVQTAGRADCMRKVSSGMEREWEMKLSGAVDLEPHSGQSEGSGQAGANTGKADISDADS